MALLNELWALASIQVNLFAPQQKLRSKTRTGATVTKDLRHRRHPTQPAPAGPPRLLDPHDRDRLAHDLTATDLLELRRRITDIQANLIELARRRGPVQPKARTTNAVYLSKRKISPPPKRAQPDESTKQLPRAI